MDPSSPADPPPPAPALAEAAPATPDLEPGPLTDGPAPGGPTATPELVPLAAPVPYVPPPAPVPLAARIIRWHSHLTRGERTTLYAFLGGGLFRILFVLLLHPPMSFDYSDMHSYVNGARDFADLKKGTDTGDWYYPTGTASWMALSLLIFGKHLGFTVASLVQGILSSIEIPLAFIAIRRFLGERIGAITAVLVATHYLYIGYAGLFMSENYLSIGLFTAFAAFVPEKPLRCLLAGICLGIGAWAKSQAFLLAPLWALWLLWQRRYASAVAVVVGAVLVVVPISILVMTKTHQLAFISTNGGQTFALGQCPIESIAFEDPTNHTGASFGVPDLYQRKGRGEVEGTWGEAKYSVPFNNSKFYMHEGVECIKRYPWHAVKMVFMHTADIFAGLPWSAVVPWPDSHTDWMPFSLMSNLFISYLIAPLAFFALWRKRREPALWAVFGLPFLSLFASSVLFHGDPRFRSPYDFTFFAAGVVGFFLARGEWRAFVARSVAQAGAAPPPPLPPEYYTEP